MNADRIWMILGLTGVVDDRGGANNVSEVEESGVAGAKISTSDNGRTSEHRCVGRPVLSTEPITTDIHDGHDQ